MLFIQAVEKWALSNSCVERNKPNTRQSVEPGGQTVSRCVAMCSI